MTMAEAVEREITIVKEDEHIGNMLTALFDNSISIVDRVIDNTLIRNVEIVTDTGKKFKRRIRSWWW